MPITVAPGQDMQALYGNFAFYVQFDSASLLWSSGATNPQMLGAFSEISGIEATMEHKVIREGGYNYGSRMRSGPVELRNGHPEARHSKVTGTVALVGPVRRRRHLCRRLGRPSLGRAIGLLTPNAPQKPGSARDPNDRKIAMGWRLQKAMPVKFRVGDLNAKGSDVAIEELHLVHEGLHVTGVL